ncbi:hypothetical protein SASPL_115077 [Salvia splendens]|uniref:Uncharacterized protein n=1 Tax=Salvia splendens TaxID=180675 RepID=A0A8X8Y2I7_SALSN|nr:hypothetical protein SASPL_115077 [Salvia splendens]
MGENTVEQGDDSNDLLTEKTAELEKAMEDLKQANEEAVQSWLDSRPLIDELEKSQAELNATRARVANANSVISEFQAQLGTTEMCIKSAKDEEHNMQMKMNVLNQDVHAMQEETEHLKARAATQEADARDLSQVEYGRLKQEANERISDSERRVSKSADEKLGAEKARDLAFRRLQSLHPQQISAEQYERTNN